MIYNIENISEEKILHQLSKEVKLEDIPKYSSLVLKMKEELDDFGKSTWRNWIWLAAPQLGELVCIVLVFICSRWVVMFNPKIVEYSKECSKGKERCLSFDYNINPLVKRSKRIKVKYFDETGSEIELILS